jgi:hypothetical protein
MKLLKILSFIGLCLTIIPSVLVFKDIISLDLYKDLMLGGSLIWLINAPFWINKVGKVKG